ncbi:unnamed protein product [Miscanthus lutarioriparius]|uniref:Uncharacterized protein n=1 Tax=Miscanthus lutarioriparius TaxID=422564 RepID=A0A811MGW1_9POAL|nr:unnamed protein product [Miscanthus lutarioriparius]
MRDSDLEATLEADRKASESYLNQSTLQPERSLVCQHMQEQNAAGWPRDHLDGAANVGVRSSDNEAKLGTGLKTEEHAAAEEV